MAQPALKVRYPLSNQTLIEAFLIQGLPWLDCEAANREVIRLNLELLRLQAKLDAVKMQEAENGL